MVRQFAVKTKQEITNKPWEPTHGPRGLSKNDKILKTPTVAELLGEDPPSVWDYVNQLSDCSDKLKRERDDFGLTAPLRAGSMPNGAARKNSNQRGLPT